MARPNNHIKRGTSQLLIFSSFIITEYCTNTRTKNFTELVCLIFTYKILLKVFNKYILFGYNTRTLYFISYFHDIAYKYVGMITIFQKEPVVGYKSPRGTFPI